MKKMRKNKMARKAIPFTNTLGQIINVGDNVVAVTVSTQRVSMRPGQYLGQTDSGNCQVMVEGHRYETRYTDTNELVKWSTFDRNRPHATNKVPYNRITTLQLNRIIKG